MSMTVAALHKRLAALIEAGHGRKPVLVNKPSFTHPCEQDGVGMLDVVNIEGPQWISMADDDGGTKFNKDGTESGKTVVLLGGGWDEEARLVLPNDPIARALGVMDDVLADIEDWEDKALAEAVREAQAGLRLAYPAKEDAEPAAEVVKMDTGGSWIERTRPLPIGTKLYASPLEGEAGREAVEVLRELVAAQDHILSFGGISYTGWAQGGYRVAAAWRHARALVDAATKQGEKP